ncbi:unnamed protein product [Musa acuminata subsp. malaccensis]|uniref:(wild Malaysian banana) hypothetical protein n=1 Tax=Musa acuminata subsp. malaccensis TaxID=214687 RepID=A0A804IKH9_MUSAM|nr:unnamed protein product [Musa acuminata subsp. malaccensis]
MHYCTIWSQIIRINIMYEICKYIYIYMMNLVGIITNMYHT